MPWDNGVWGSRNHGGTTFLTSAHATRDFLANIFAKARLWIDRLPNNFTPIQTLLIPTLHACDGMVNFSLLWRESLPNTPWVERC